MTAAQMVFAAAAALVVVSIALVGIGVGLVAGAGYALIATGGLLGVSAVGAGVLLLREPDGRRA